MGPARIGGLIDTSLATYIIYSVAEIQISTAYSGRVVLICHRLLKRQFCTKALSYLCTALSFWNNVCLCSIIFLLKKQPKQ